MGEGGQGEDKSRDSGRTMEKKKRIEMHCGRGRKRGRKKGPEMEKRERKNEQDY